MRLDGAVTQIVEVWHQLLEGYRAGQLPEPALARQCLESIAKYIVWIDLGLIANEKFVGLFYQFLGDRETRKEAVACLAALVDKGMGVTAKLELVKSLQLGQVLQALSDTSLDEDEELCAEVAALVNVAGSHLIEAWKGLAAPQKEDALASVLQLIPQLLRFLSHQDNEISEEVIEFATAYIDSYNKQDNGPAAEVHRANFGSLLKVLMKKAEYPEDYNFNAEEEFEVDVDA